MPNFMQAARAAKVATIVAVCLVAGETVCFGQATPAAPEAQSADAIIRTRIEELRVTGALVAQGESLDALNLLPRIYENREFTPAWRTLAQVDGLLGMIDASYLEGLDPNDYHVAALRAVRSSLTNLDALPPAERADFDLLLTDSIIRLGYHLRFGKVDPTALDPNWNSSRELDGEDPAVTIQSAIDAPSLREFAARVIPRAFLYERFKKALADYRAMAANGGWPSVPAGPTLRPNSSDERVPALAARLAVTGDFPPGAAPVTGTMYAGSVVDAVRNFQARHGLGPDGIVGAATLAELNVPVAARVEQIRANLERVRWVFYDPESEFLVVNIAGFRLYLLRRGDVVWRTRVQVGRPYRQTPIFKAEMTYLVVNPTWTVPPGILRNDIVPAVRRNPDYLASRNIELFDQNNMLVDPATVDWSRRSFPYRFVQRPGPDNALGRIKFMFPNEHSVYLHDTPSLDLFDRDSRAFSSGCIRVENPFELAEQLLGARARDRLDAVVASGRTQTVFLDKPMTVTLLYWTVEPDAEGHVTFLPDVYERDADVIAALAEPFSAPETL